MTRVVVRLILTILLAPLAAVMAIGTVLFADFGLVFRSRDREAVVAILLSVSAYVLAVLIGVIWMGVVRWNRSRRRRTFWACSAAIFAATFAVFFGLWLFEWTRNYLAPIVSMNALIALALGASFPILWRESASERLERLSSMSRHATRCPHCRYDLAGATTLICPECGLTLTLGTLLQETTRRSGADAFD